MIDVEQPHVLPGLVARLPRLCSNARTGFVCPTESARQRLRAIGVPFTACTLIRDPVGASAVKRGNRAELRRELDISEEHIAVLILPPVRRATGALVAAWGAMLLEHTRPGVCLILPDVGREVARVARLVESCRLRRMLRRVGWRFSLPELLAATDLAVYVPTDDAPLWGVAQAMAAGRPIIASDVRIARELLTHGRTAWLCRANDPKDTCRRMLRALEDREQSERVGEAARAHAHAAFDRRRALGQYRRAYLNLLADRPVGGGLADVVLVR
jgi:glycosyltransferase involved in cell wall biosynthesis